VGLNKNAFDTLLSKAYERKGDDILISKCD
jgi:hypothetical protein